MGALAKEILGSRRRRKKKVGSKSERKAKVLRKAKKKMKTKVNAKGHDLVWYAKERRLKAMRLKNQQSTKAKTFKKQAKFALHHFNRLYKAHRLRKKKGDTFTKWTSRVAKSWANRAVKKIKKKMKKVSKGKVDTTA